MVLGESGILTKAKQEEKYSRADTREKLELVLVNFQAKRAIGENYEEIELDTALQHEGMEVEGKLVIVDGWQFEIDRSIPKIVAELERLSEEDLKKATIKK